MASSSSTGETAAVFSDTAVRYGRVRSRSAPQPFQYNKAGLQHTLFCLNTSGTRNLELVLSPAAKGPRFSDYSSEFERWCISNKIYYFYPIHNAPFQTFIKQKDLQPCSKDPEDYPGMQHVASLLLRDSKAKDGDTFGILRAQSQELLKCMLNRIFSSALADKRFVIGKKIDNGKAGEAWVINSQLSNIDGNCNHGVYLVHNANDANRSARIMKTLPPPAMYPGFADREIEVLGALQHDNIIKFFDGGPPKSRYETAWIITEYCDKGTLTDLVIKYEFAETSIPERFIWDIFESLARAVVYLHYGPKLLNEFDQTDPASSIPEISPDMSWDPVWHRDIILSNIFCTSNTEDQSKYPIVKLGDFGCAMRQSEVETKDLDTFLWADKTPIMDGAYEPPEGQYATESVDVYMLGITLSCIVQTQSSPYWLDKEAMLPENFETSVFAHYSTELCYVISECTKPHPPNRIKSLSLLHLVRHTKRRLISENLLPFDELLP
jgi:serine/threonine protein kinase